MSTSQHNSTGGGGLLVSVLTCTHATAPLAVREKLSIAPERVGNFYTRLRKLPGVAEAVVLSTCNRVEIYTVTRDTNEHLLRESILLLLAGQRSLAAGVVAAHCRWLTNLDALRHLFFVASGVDSQMVGETEILGQAKEAYALALARKETGPVLNRAFQKSFQASAWTHTNTHIGHGQISIGNVAVELASRIFGELGDNRVLVLGTGEVGRKTAQSFVSRGARSLTVASRTFANAEHLAASIRGTPVELAEALRTLEHYDIVIGSASTVAPFLSTEAVRAAAQARAGEPLFLIDLGMPRNFSPDSATISNVYLYNLDDLSAIANENLRARQADLERAKNVLEDKSSRLWKTLAGQGAKL